MAIQVIHLDKKEERLAWLIENINKINGTGIIYCLTKNDCKLVSKLLNDNGLKACAYYSS